MHKPKTLSSFLSVVPLRPVTCSSAYICRCPTFIVWSNTCEYKEVLTKNSLLRKLLKKSAIAKTGVNTRDRRGNTFCTYIIVQTLTNPDEFIFCASKMYLCRFDYRFYNIIELSMQGL